jgi:oligoribonuclease (3'-5' exoribonuclease)
MIYVSIDIETSGLEYKKHNVLSIGAIIEDTEKKLPFDDCPKFNALVVQREIVGSPTALTMNSNIISLMSDYIETDNEGRIKLQELENNKSYGYEFHDQDNVVKAFYWFLYQ